MLYSMTGYGKAAISKEGLTLSVEMRSLNSKGLELALKVPSAYRPQELGWRNTLAQSLERGKIDVLVLCEKGQADVSSAIDLPLLEKYTQQLLDLANRMGIPSHNILDSALKLPGVLSAQDTESESAIPVLEELMAKALREMHKFRETEGTQLESDIVHRIRIILNLLEEAKKIEPNRSERVRNHLKEQLHMLIGQENFDQNRMEQEMIYYIEKLDITEEFVRLQSHCDYFFAVLNEEAMAKGRKLAFISQEIGREINTIGSKANDKDLQQVVVQMKDELEKIKEQLNNVL